jgi:hypothetical protein
MFKDGMLSIRAHEYSSQVCIRGAPRGTRKNKSIPTLHKFMVIPFLITQSR